MRLTGKNEKFQAPSVSPSMAESLESSLMDSIIADHRSYHELEDMPILEVDELTQFRTNIQVLADLTSRLSFLNREIRYVMKVD
ncbi:MAG: hypothetical protein H7326_01370 [Bdellovibrionaceae bacterium]|nr:hypothetical protein [Pseudobdellovibrionaceae bacterium]